MKIKLSRLLQALTLAILAAACSAEPEGSTPEKERTVPYPGSELVTGPPRFHDLSKELREELGVGPDDFVVAITEKGPIIYCKGKCPDKPMHELGSKGHFPAGKKAFQFIEIWQTRESPSCYEYRDGNGYTKWYPSPPCPM